MERDELSRTGNFPPPPSKGSRGDGGEIELPDVEKEQPVIAAAVLSSEYSVWRENHQTKQERQTTTQHVPQQLDCAHSPASSSSTVPKEEENVVQSGDAVVLELFELESFNTTMSSQHQKPPQDTTKKNIIKPSHWRLAWDFALDWVCSILVGFLVVSYWRGTWTLLDIWSCNQPGTAGMVNGEVLCFVGLQDEPKYADIRRDTAWHSLVAGYALLSVGIFAMNRGWWQPGSLRAFMHLSDPSVRSTMSADTEALTFRITKLKTVIRFAIVYLLGNGTVCLWRAIWYILDAHVFPDDVLKSYWTTTVAGAGLCFFLCSGASLLAPPAIFLLDGPSRSAPPLASTIVMSYRSVALPVGEADILNEQDSFYVVVADMAVSFLVLPWGVVGFWRGFWSLMDNYLWGFTTHDKDLRLSIVYSLAIGAFCLLMASDDVVQFIPTKKQNSSLLSALKSESVGRVRTIVLAVGVVNVWRGYWYIWDEWLGQTQVWSAALSHVLGVVLLFLAGCLSCITAPPATTGVDAVAHPCCADEPLFHNVPVPNEALFACAMGRSPDGILGDRASSEVFLPPSVSQRFVTSLRNIDSRFSLQNRDQSISSDILSLRHQSVRRGTEFFRNR